MCSFFPFLSILTSIFGSPTSIFSLPILAICLGFQLLFNNIQKILKNKNDLRSWLKMQWGSYYSVAALLNSTSGPAGLFSYYLSTNFNIPQGLGYAVSGFNYLK